MRIVYPDLESVIEANKLVLKAIKVLKADRHEILAGGREKMQKVLEDVKSSKGGVYDKAAILLRGLVQARGLQAETGEQHMLQQENSCCTMQGN